MQFEYPVYWSVEEFCDGFLKLIDHLQLDKVGCGRRCGGRCGDGVGGGVVGCGRRYGNGVGDGVGMEWGRMGWHIKVWEWGAVEEVWEWSGVGSGGRVGVDVYETVSALLSLLPPPPGAHLWCFVGWLFSPEIGRANLPQSTCSLDLSLQQFHRHDCLQADQISKSVGVHSIRRVWDSICIPTATCSTSPMLWTW